MDSIVYTIKSLILLGILTGGNGIAIPYISDGLLERTLEHFMQCVRFVRCALCCGGVYVEMGARWKEVFIAYV